MVEGDHNATQREVSGPPGASALPESALAAQRPPTFEGRTWAAAAFLGWLPLVAVNAVFVRRVHVELYPLERTLHHLYDAGQVLGLAAASWLLVRALWRLPLSIRAIVGCLVVYASQYALLGADLESFLERNEGSHVPWRSLFAGVSTLALACSLTLGRLLTRSVLRWAGIGAGVALAVGNHLVLLLDYPGTHAILAWIAAALIGASGLSMADLNVPRGIRRTAVAAGLAALLSYAVPAGPVVRSALLGSSGAVAAPFVTRLWARLQTGRNGRPRHDDPAWFKPRWRLPAVPAELLPGAPPAPIVILLTVDALRNDVVEGPEYKKDTPNFRAMAKHSLRFQRVWSPAAYTKGSLRSLLHGMFFSQAVGHQANPDQGPEPLYLVMLLENAKVHTVLISPAHSFDRDRGITTGFGEETYIGDHAPSETVVAKVIERIDAGARGPLFIYSHIFDPHSPYDRGGTKASLKESYVAEVSMVDTAIGTLRRELKKRKLDQSTYLIVTADHAEAFNEHGRYHHGSTVYEEMIRVPLLLEGPGIRPRRVKRSASVMDVAPTVLSLFGVATAPHFMGQSLVPFMRGEDPWFTRPLAVDGARHICAMLFEDRWKAIIDFSHETEELYDLHRDPGEQLNLAESPKAKAYFSTMRAFFAGMNAPSPTGDKDQPSPQAGAEDL